MRVNFDPGYPPDFDAPHWCGVCGKADRNQGDRCECPECPACGEIGDSECFGRCVGFLPTRYEYVVAWNNDHACDELGTFESHAEAERAGADWLAEMIAIEPDQAGREEAEESYSYEVNPVEVKHATPSDIRAAIAAPPGTMFWVNEAPFNQGE